MSSRKLHDTTSLCATCKNGVPAEIVETDGRIIMRKACPEHGRRDILIASDSAWYHEAMSHPPVLAAPAGAKDRASSGCPYDCGPCAAHRQKMYLPVIAITSACNLNCPICYTINKNTDPFHMSLREFAAILDVMRRNDPGMKIVNLTGGEPTMHPELTEIIRLCHDAGIHRVTISTHGLTFLKNERMLEELAELRARIILSFDTFNEETYSRMTGARLFRSKMQVLDLLAKYNVDTTFIPVLALGYNDRELGALVDLVLGRDFIRSLEIHTMTFTGRGGLEFDATARITTPDVLRNIEEQTAGKIRASDFTPSPCAHPLCYQTCYLLRTADNVFIPFTRFMSKENVRTLLTDNLYMEPGERMENVVQDVINDLWSRDSQDQSGRQALKALKDLLLALFPERSIPYGEQQVISERSAKAIYIHAHMDEENVDTDRLRQCCVAVPSADGSTVPTCSYNILYRCRDRRFCAKEQVPLQSYTGGRKWRTV
jgi:hypothetical protein